MTTRTIKLAMGQMRVEGGDVEGNLERAWSMIRHAADQSAEIVVLPECLDIGWTHPSARKKAQPVPGPTAEVLCASARQAGVFVAAGLTERDGEKIYNTALLIAPDGEILLVHRKINILKIAQDLYSIGDRLGVAHTDLGTIGLNICADNFANSVQLGHAQARMGAQLLISPSAWAVPADHDNAKDPYGDDWKPPYTKLASAYSMPVVGVSNVGWMTGGPWEGWKCIGCSLAVGNDGSIAAEGPYGVEAESLIMVDLELSSRETSGTCLAERVHRNESENQ
jgi:predicted amidohydrolase